MADTCEESGSMSWELLAVKAKYWYPWPYSPFIFVELLWEYTVECSGVCPPGNVCIPRYTSGRVLKTYDLMDVKNRDIPFVDRQALKSCYLTSLEDFIDCAAGLGFGIRDLIRPDLLTTPPTGWEYKESCECYTNNLTSGGSDILGDFKVNQKSEENFWKRFIMSVPKYINW